MTTTTCVKIKHFANAATLISAMQELAPLANMSLTDLFVLVDGTTKFWLAGSVRLMRNQLSDGSSTYDLVIAP